MTKPRPRVTCPHCGKSGIAFSMKRWHFDKCRQNPQAVQQQEIVDAKTSEKIAKFKSAKLLAQAADDNFLRS
jgi:ssDNA-binding Zn-finger/Zn-ribbon topoisomerase 1